MDNTVMPEPVAAEARRQHTPYPYAITVTLIVINVLVFLAMVASGVSFIQPTPVEALRWGADFAPLTFGAGQWWRLLTACFVHYGIIHIGMNMYVLFQIGPFIEIVFGRVRYLVLYFLAGLGGSLVSLWIHPFAVGAGASGAIFGLYGAVFAYLLVNRGSLEPESTRSIARTAGLFLLYNLIFGAASRTTDLSAHFGGLVFGFLFGLLLGRKPR